MRKVFSSTGRSASSRVTVRRSAPTRGQRGQINRQAFLNFVQNPAANEPMFCQWFLAHNTLMLDGRNRINLIIEQNTGDPQAGPQSSFQVLFRDNARRSEVRRIVAEALGTHFVLDATEFALGSRGTPPVADARPRSARRIPHSKPR